MNLIPILATLAATLLVGFALLRRYLPQWMLPECRSPHGLEETVTRLADTAKAAGWVVQSIIELEKSIEKNGGGVVRPVRLVNLCQARHAAAIMRDDTARRASVLMPCTISVYEKADGSIWVGAMNPGLIAPFFGGVIAAVMGGPVARDQADFIRTVCR
jgi:uncharacterized protein (DUF302 family)